MAAIQVKSTDIDLLMKEFEITRERADLYLRENNGNVEETIHAVLAS